MTSIYEAPVYIHCNDIPAAKACLAPLQSARGTCLWCGFFCGHLRVQELIIYVESWWCPITFLRNRLREAVKLYRVEKSRNNRGLKEVRRSG